MDSLIDVWQETEYLAGILKEITKPGPNRPTHKDLTEIRDDFSKLSETVQTIRDTYFEE